MQKGDRVKFLDDVGGGLVTQVLDKERVMVLTDDGFEVPARKCDLLVEQQKMGFGGEDRDLLGEADAPQDRFQDTLVDEITETESDVDDADDDTEDFSDELYLAFLQGRATAQNKLHYEAYLINDTADSLLYLVAKRNEGNAYHLLKKGVLMPGTKMLLEEFSIEQLMGDDVFFVQGLRFCNEAQQSFELKNPIHKELTVPYAGFLSHEAFVTTDFFEQKAALFPLTSGRIEAMEKHIEKIDFAGLINQKEQSSTNDSNKAKQAHKAQKKTLREVDLHLHELIDDEQGLKPEDMLKLQVARCRQELDDAITKQEKKLVFIHGKGNGRLRYEIQQLVSRHYPNASCQDASFQEYGFGATMVIIHRY